MKSKSVILDAKRSPIGAYLGALSELSAVDIASSVIKAILENNKINPSIINEVILGNVLSAGQGQAPARQAALKGGCVSSVESLTINKMCGSGLKSIMLADQAIRCEDAEIIIAGGMESMSNAPHIIKNLRRGKKFGHDEIIDSMIHDGLWDAYTNQHMGSCAELLVSERKYTRHDLDQFAIESYSRAQYALKNNIFDTEIIPIKVDSRNNGASYCEIDEEPGNARFEKIPNLKPVFKKDGIITAANASKLNDGSSILLIASEAKAKELGIRPIAKILSHASVAHTPEWFTTAPGKAISKVLAKAKLDINDIDLWEINEAFAPVAMAAIDDFKIDYDRVNIYGGAIALGHPIGASGARILTTLINGMKRNKFDKGLATLCIGGGEASAIIIERYD